MPAKRNVSRRGFIAATASTLAAPYVIPASALGKDGTAPPSERVTIGTIGTGGMGNSNMRRFARHPDAQLVAVCDVDKKHLHDSAARARELQPGGKCDAYDDFRKLIERKDIDAVCVATPDHWHALISVAAAEAGKDIFCQKPMTHTFGEGQAVIAAVKKYNRIFQVGSQQRSRDLFRRAAKVVLNGHIGKIKRIEVGLPTGHQAVHDRNRVPDGIEIDYNFWCGPSPKIPFDPRRLHWNWRWHLSFGGGQLMDWIGHHNDIAHWGTGMDLWGPIEVKAVGFDYPADRTIWNSAVNYEVLAKYEAGFTTSISNKNEMGCKWIGENGWVYVNRGPFRASDPELTKESFDPGTVKVYHSPEHERNFLDGVKTRKPCICPAEIGHRSITPGHLGLLSDALGGRVLKWDPKTETIVGDAEADRLLKRVDYRDPWSLT